MKPWHFAVRAVNHPPSHHERAFIAWCAQTPDLGAGPCDIPMSEEVLFSFGPTAEDAMHKLRERLHARRGPSL
jgi:hypothetical protein